MNINYKEPQFELFPANSATLEDINKPKFLLATLTLSTESLVIFVILGIMIALFSFSLGVERGRSLAAQSLDEKVAAAWKVGGRRLAVAPVVPQAVNTNMPTNLAVKNSGNKGILHSMIPFSHPIAVSKVSIAKMAVPVAKTVPVAAVAITPAVATSNKWTVQVATYRNENYAQQEALGLKTKGYPTFIIKSKDFYLVCVGSFGSQTQADSIFKKFQAKYQGSQVRRF